MTAEWHPTEDQRLIARTMAGYGVPHSDIARVLGITENTLRKRCQDDLHLGMAQANAKVAQTLFQLATRDPAQATSANVTAAIFWAKTRMGWKDRISVEQLDEHGNAVTPNGRQEFVLTIERGPATE